MQPISRKKFLVNGAVLATLSPFIQFLQGCGNDDERNLVGNRFHEGNLSFDKGLRYINDNGAYLYFYFINARTKGSKILPEVMGKESYLIVQVPPQSLHEQAFPSPNTPTGQLPARLARPSFFAFKLWPGWDLSKRTMDLSFEQLLNLEDPESFHLLTTFDVAANRFRSFANRSDVKSAVIPLEDDEDSVQNYNGLEYYYSILSKVFLDPSNADKPFISIIEMPAQLLMVPHIREKEMKARILQNKYGITRKDYSIKTNDKAIRRTVLERWSAQMVFEKAPTKNASFIPYNSLPPVLRAIGLRLKNDQPITDEEIVDTCRCQSNEDPDGYLPTLLDNHEIVYLNQLGRKELQGPEYDIRIGSRDEKEQIQSTPFLLTSLGATLKFNYYNLKPPDKMSLVEYEHHFQDGRDNYIRVARIGVCAPSSEKMVHVKVAKRKIGENGKSYMELKHYIKKVDEFIEFPKYERDGESPDKAGLKYISVFNHVPDDGDAGYKTYTNRLPFSEITALFKQSPPIRPPEAAGADPCSCDDHFWVYKENPAGVDYTDTYKDLLMLPFQYVDRNGNVHKIENGVYFIRKDFFEDDGTKIKRLLGYIAGTQSVFAQYENEPRFRLFFNDQPISYTSDPPLADVKAHGFTEIGDPDKNRINHSPTDYIEYYFDVANLAENPQTVFDKVPLVIYSQMRRAKINPEQFQQYSGNKVSSLIKFHNDYLKYRFKADNIAKLVFHHRKDFMENKWQSYSNTYDAVTDKIDRQFSDGYQKIKNLFSNAGSRIGALVNPDVQVERFALIKQCYTLPDTINEQWKTNITDRVVKTAEILKGPAAELFNGIKFLSILKEELKGENSPLFFLNKIAGEIDNIDGFINGIQSNVVRKVFQSVKGLNTDIQNAQSAIDTARNQLARAQAQVKEYQLELYKKVPDLTTLKAAIHRLFEAQRLSFIKETARIETTIQSFIADEFAVIMRAKLNVLNKDPFEAQCLLNWSSFKKQYLDDGARLLNDLTTLAANVDAATRRDITVIQDLLKTNVNNLVDRFYGFVPSILNGVDIPVSQDYNISIRIHFNKDIQVLAVGEKFIINPAAIPANPKIVDWTEIVWEQVNWAGSSLDHLENWGIEQLKILEIQLSALDNRIIVGRDTLIADIRTKLANAAQKIENSIYNKAIGYRDQISAAIARIQPNLVADTQKELGVVLSYLDIIYQSTHSNYYQRFLQLKKDYNDIILKLQSFGSLVPDYESLKKNPDFWVARKAREFNTKKQELAGSIRQLQLDKVQTLGEEADKLLESLDTQLSAITDPLIREVSAEIKTLKQNLDEEYKTIKTVGDELKKQLDNYASLLKSQATEKLDYLKQQFELELARVTDQEEVKQARKDFQQLLGLYQAVKRQEYTYHWETGDFRKADLPLLKFDPQLDGTGSKMNVDVHVLVYMDPLRAPNVVEKVETKIENRLTNFTITFFSILSVGFNEVRFVSGTGIPAQTTVSVRDIKFEGALSFIQKLEELLQSLGEGFHLEISTSSVALSYAFTVPTITTPTFTFANFSIGVGVKIFFSNRPMAIVFSLATPDSKATVAAGIFGGAFFARLTADPKNGIQEIEMALEMGVYIGISIGIIHGEVRLMVGLYYKKEPSGVTLEGYLVAEGTLSVWIISVTARLYMGVRSKNSSVEGVCTVTLTIKIGFLKKSFSGSYRKQIKGAENTNRQTIALTRQYLQEEKNYMLQKLNTITPESQPHDAHYMLLSELIEIDEYQMLSGKEWNDFFVTFYQ